jgi:hypothetical protein
MEQEERLAALKAEFARQQQSDKKAAALLDKINAGKSTFSDATQYSLRLGALLGRAFKAVLASEEDKACLLDPDAASALVRPLLAQSASLAGNAAEQAIRTQNQAVGIGLNAQTADPQRVSDRIDGIVTSVSMQPDADSALDALERESVSFTASAADEALEASGNFLASVGRSAKIVRVASANACAWCLEREGTYEYPGVPKDIFQRHANCTCTLEYIPSERGDKQNAKVKKQAQETQRRTDLKTLDVNSARQSEASARALRLSSDTSKVAYYSYTDYQEMVKNATRQLASGTHLDLDGKPNSITELLYDDGSVKQRRVYGPDGRSLLDYDTDDHGNPKRHPTGAHKHTYSHSQKNPHGSACPLTDYDLKYNQDVIQEGVNYHATVP